MTHETLPSSYNYGLVVLSILIAILASYTALDLAGRVIACHGRARLAWLSGGAVSMGIGIWSMHYVGMLAFSLPIPIQYDWPTVLLALLSSVSAAACALYVVSQDEMWPVHAFAGSVFMGGAIIGLHYIAMDSMRLAAMCHYSPMLVALSALVAFAGSWMALWLTFFVRRESPGSWSRRMSSGFLMGAAIASMHYTAMAAASFTGSAEPPDLSHAVSISTLAIAGMSGVPAIVLLITLLTSMVDRLQERTTLLDQLFDQGPNALALVNSRGGIVRINQEFTRVFGYTRAEALGRPLKDLILCGEPQSLDLADLVNRGQRVDLEDSCRRKDGSTVDVAIILAPFSLPKGHSVVFAIYRDITERKRADDSLRELSGRLLRLQDEERRRLARELHDSTGQKLAALAMNLSAVDESAALLNARARAALAESLDLTQQCLREIRTLAYLLHPPELEELGLADAARDYINGFAQRSGIPVELELPPDLGRLPPDVETALFRILQESLNNVHRHSGSPGARVRIQRNQGAVIMQIQDEGQGMDEGAARREGVGVAGMRERVRQLGGFFEMHSTESGTTLKVVLPLD